MSTPIPSPTLFVGLIDDAAVFPPGSHPIDEALRRRFDRAATTDARYVGSFLVPPALVTRTLAEVHPVPVVVIGRPGAELGAVIAAAESVAGSDIHALAGIQVGHQVGWEQTLELGVPAALEVDPANAEATLDSIAPQRFQVSAKVRTGATETNPVPTPEQLATFLVGARDRGLSVRLTGGLHHAITHGTDAGREFGFLNVLAAIDRLLTADVEPTALLDERDAAVVLDAVRAIDDARAHAVRDFFTGFGCCEVDDPIRELHTLGLIAPTFEEHS